MIIGIMGKAGSGKDTIGLFIQHLLATHGTVKRYAFANALKDQISLFLGIPRYDLNDENYKKSLFINKNDLSTCMDGFQKNKPEEYWTLREFMQYFGTDVMQKAFGKNVWINKVNNKIIKDNTMYAIITDVRFKSEYDYIKNNNGVIIKVVNPNLESTDTHISENDLNDVEVDYCINNDWKNYPDQIYKEVYGITKQIRNKRRDLNVL